MKPKDSFSPDQDNQVREVVGVFDTLDRLQSAIDDLLIGGFDQAQLSLLASEDAVREKLGRDNLSVSKLEDDPDVPRMEYVSPESRDEAKAALIGGLFYLGVAGAAFAVLASGGAMAAAIASAAVAGGGGGLLGAALAGLIGKQEATWTEQQLSLGGLVLWVRPWDSGHERQAVEIMKRNGGKDVHAHVVNS
jgi:hypothetical protein